VDVPRVSVGLRKVTLIPKETRSQVRPRWYQKEAKWAFVQKLSLNKMNQFVAHLHQLLSIDELIGGRYGNKNYILLTFMLPTDVEGGIRYRIS
jgi:hypothetical protein